MAELDLTKHSGGLSATNELIGLCRITTDTYVLDVGCGVGITPCYLARKYGCRVVGIDILESMIDRSNERARRQGLEEFVEFHVADVQSLHFGDGEFDVVIGESILAFVNDKQKAVNEAVRVLKAGGFFGVTETAWLEDPSPESLALVAQSFEGKFNPLTSVGWEQLLLQAGLRDIVTITHDITVLSEAINRLRRLGLVHFSRTLYKALFTILTKPIFREVMKGAMSEPRELINSWEYGIFIGRK
jgi:ubiquinone/menaquinone biosynthesis C-methylase UbiE